MSLKSEGKSSAVPRYRNQTSDSGGVLFSRDEMNLAEFPLAVLSTRVNPKVKTLEFSDTHRAPSGELVERKWVITGADKFGLPTSTDDDVVLGLMRLTMDKGFRERKIYFTRYELLRALRWSTEGRSYQRLIKSLDRLSGVRIRSSNSFYDNEAKAYQTCNFGVIDAYEINDGRKPNADGEIPKSYFIWSEMLFDSFQAGYIKKIDLELYFSLKSATSRRLYRYLDKHFYYRGTLERPLMHLAFEKIGISRAHKYVSSIRQQLEPALEELISVGFLSSYEFSGRGELAKIKFIAGGDVRPQAEPVAALRENDASKELVELLVTRGMAKIQASRLISLQPKSRHSRVRQIIEYYDKLVAKGDYKVSKNRVGFLYRAVERAEEFVLPEDSKKQAAKVAAEAASKRPELKIFKAQSRRDQHRRKASSPTKSERATKSEKTRVTIERESGAGAASSMQADPNRLLAQKLSELSTAEVRSLHASVEEKLSCLKSILSPEKYAEAVSACLLKELS